MLFILLLVFFFLYRFCLILEGSLFVDTFYEFHKFESVNYLLACFVRSNLHQDEILVSGFIFKLI